MVKDQEFLKSKASYCIDLAKKMGATDASVTVGHSISETVNFRNKSLEASDRSDGLALSIETYLGKRRSSISSSNLLDAEIKTLIDEIDNIDLVLVMSVNPGFGGQKFMPEVLDKIKELKKIKDKNQYHFDIEVDGGINFSNSKIVLEAGADILVSGTTVFKENDGDIKTNIEKLKSM